MRRYQLGLLTAILPLLMFSLLVMGCGGKKTDDDDDLPTGKTAKTVTKTAPKATLKPVKATEYGTITGKITWTGDKPDLGKMTEDLRKGMVTDKDYCLSGKEYETTEQTFRIGKNGNLGNVFVWIVPEEGSYFEVPNDQLEKFKNSVVQIGQPHCAFMPHASVLFPSTYKDGKQEPTGQKLVVENDAKVSHNSKVQGGALNPMRDQTLAPNQNKEYVLKPDKTVITVSCGIHSWMKGYLRAFDHPYAAVSSVGADLKDKKYENDEAPEFGTFEIKGVPVGAKVRILAWHEALEWLDGNVGRELTIKKDNVVNFDAKTK